MPIAAVCANGHKLAAKDALAGKKIKCPKCGSVVQLPKLNSPLTRQEADDDDSGIDPQADDEWPSLDNISGDHEDFRALPPRVKSAVGVRSKSSSSPTEKESDSSHRLSLLLALVGGGSFLTVLVLGLSAWFLFGKNGSSERNPDSVRSNAQVPNNPEPGNNGTPGVIELPTPNGDAAPQSLPGRLPDSPVVVVTESRPGQLTRIEIDKRIEGFKLPGKTWAAAYDEVTGRLAVTNDEQGILVYDIDEILNGKLEPEVVLPTNGMPTAVCLKPLADQRVFVVASRDNELLTLFDADTLKQSAEVVLTDLTFVDFLAGSTNPSDSSVYYSTSNDRNHKNPNRLGRVDILTGKQDGHTLEQFDDIMVPPQGDRLYARGLSGTWAELLQYQSKDRGRSPVRLWYYENGAYRVWWLGTEIGTDTRIFTPTLNFNKATLDYAPGPVFSHRPLLVGLGKNELVIASTNNYQQLASVPLPEKFFIWDSPDEARDFRFHRKMNVEGPCLFQDLFADSSRDLGILTLSEHLVIVPLARLNLPSEPTLTLQTELPQKLAASKLLELDLQLKPEVEGAVFEFVPNAEGLPGNPHMLLINQTPVQTPGIRLQLAAAVNGQQNIILVNDLKPLNGEALPRDLVIGDEKMLLIDVDDFATALKVIRTEPANHSVASDIFVLPKSSDVQKSGPTLPTVNGSKLQWTPSAEQVGQHFVRLRVKAGEATREWFWEVVVEPNVSDLPFYLTGIEPAADSNLAVIWGQAHPSPLDMRHDWKAPAEPNTYFIGIYDPTTKKVVRHTQVPKPIMAAAMNKTEIYASLISFDLTPNDLSNEFYRRRDLAHSTPTEIISLDVEKLSVTGQVQIPRHSDRLVLAGDRYLAASNFRFTIPKLKPVEPDVIEYKYPIAGKLKDGYVWDGVVWDRKMKEPQLLLFPIHFESSNAISDDRQILTADGMIFMKTNGNYACEFKPRGVDGLQSRSNFTRLSFSNGLLTGYSYSGSSRSRNVQSREIKIVDWSTLPQGRNLQPYIAEADKEVFVALQGKLHTIPLDQLISEEAGFRFVEKQDKFVLDLGKQQKLTYSAPGAAKFKLQMWVYKPRFGDEEPTVVAESTTGTFQLVLDEKLAFHALELVRFRQEDQTPEQRLQRVTEFINKVTPAYKDLTGRKPKGIPFAVYVAVVAEHNDGQQSTGIAHSYLIDVPLEFIRQQIASR